MLNLPPQNESASPDTPNDTALLLAFVRERDVECPRCGYNLRNLTQPVCPECHELLILKVGVRKFRLVWLILMLAPGLFSAIAFGMFLTMCALHGWPNFPIEGALTVAFLALSGVLAAIGGLNANRIWRWSDQAQIAAAIITWSIHLLVFAIVASNA